MRRNLMLITNARAWRLSYTKYQKLITTEASVESYFALEKKPNMSSDSQDNIEWLETEGEK